MDIGELLLLMRSFDHDLHSHRQPNIIVRDEDGAFIPTDPDNRDYQEYLAWLDEGNEPTPYTPPSSSKRRLNWPRHKRQTTNGSSPTSAGMRQTGATSSMRPPTRLIPLFTPTSKRACRLARSPCSAAPAPTNWVLCQGQSLDTTGTYAALFAILGYAFGGSGANFNLPNFTDIFPIGASATRALAAKGGAATVTLDATMIPAHTHTATQPTHTHTASQGRMRTRILIRVTRIRPSASQDSHVHGARGHGASGQAGGTIRRRRGRQSNEQHRRPVGGWRRRYG